MSVPDLGIKLEPYSNKGPLTVAEMNFQVCCRLKSYHKFGSCCGFLALVCISSASWSNYSLSIHIANRHVMLTAWTVVFHCPYSQTADLARPRPC